MENSESDVTIFITDEYGRTNIKDKKIFEFISGAVALLPIPDGERCNHGCGSNVACFNVKC